MPWSGLRVQKPSDPGDAFVQHSVVNPYQLERRDERALHSEDNIMQCNCQQPGNPLSPSADLTERLNAAEKVFMSGRSGGSNTQDSHLRPQRFNMLRLRHASDSQLSKTAKSQSAAPTSPMSLGELFQIPET